MSAPAQPMRRPVVQVVLMLTAALASAGCFRHVMEERQLGNLAYLSFPLLQGEAEVSLSGEHSYSFTARGGRAHYEVEAGRYRLILTRSGAPFVDTDIYVSAGQTKEIEAR